MHRVKPNPLGLSSGFCACCGQPCEGEAEDQGVGEWAMGSMFGCDESWVWVSQCCGVEILSELPKAAERPAETEPRPAA